MGVPGRIGGAFTNMAQQGLAANERFMQGEGADRPFLPSTDNGGRIGALASFLASNMALGGPAGSLGAGPSIARRAAALPMDEASRAQRAGQLGFTDDLYHATPQHRADAITEFRPGREGGTFFYRDPDHAAAFGDAYFKPYQRGEGGYKGMSGGGYALMPVKANPGRQAVLDFTEIEPNKVWTPASAAPLTERINRLKAEGYDSVVLRNIIEPDTGVSADQIVVLKPENIRSRFAQFDPARRNEADLLAGYGPNPLAAALSAQPQE